jgi:hypothetical protein
MRKIPCRLCPKCNIYHDVSVLKCDECESDLSEINIVLLDKSEIPFEQLGDIDENREFYVQKCSGCGALNYSYKENSPVVSCFNCHRTRVASVERKLFIDECYTVKTNVDPMINKNESGNVATDDNHMKVDTFLEDTDDEDDGAPQWASILGNIRKATGTSENVVDKELLAKEKTEEQKHITLTAVDDKHIIFTITPEKTYMLGRSANQSDYLSRDKQVGNEHCLIFFENDIWYVKDNNSSNGTFVDGIDIGLGGVRMLHNKSKIKLGHRNDSPIFEVSL